MATLTAYPDPNPETSTVDGWIVTVTAGTNWATLIAAAGNAADSTATILYGAYMQSTSTTDEWDQLVRSEHLYDTSSLTADATISSATQSGYCSSKADNHSATPDTCLYSSAPASNTAVANADSLNIGSTAFASAISFGSITAAAYNDFVMNATGIAAIDKTGITKLGYRNANYDVAASAPNWVSAVNSSIVFRSADQTGTANDPKLVVNYSLGNLGSPIYILV